MRYYFAPMEGLTDSVYRRLHSKYFPGVTRYYTPFFSPTVHRALTPREARELPAADTLAACVIPQVLTKVPEDLLWLAGVCRDLGYSEMNLNLGCPSGTVVSKGKGSGLLRDPDGLDRFLDAVFSQTPLPISIKTRLGLDAEEEFPALLEIFNRYPIRELTLHPRVRQDFYKGRLHMDAFRYCLANSKNPVCYNGGLCSQSDIRRFTAEFPQVEAVMVGRGLIGDPGLLSPGMANRETLEAFYDELLEEYLVLFGGSRNAMFRLKENWRYLICKFGAAEALGKRLRKTTDLAEYRRITREIFQTLPILDAVSPDW